MSFIAKSFLSYFSSNKNKNQYNSNQNNNDDLKNLFKTTKTTKDAKIFSTSENSQNVGIFSFSNKKENNNIFQKYSNDYAYKKIIYNKNKEHSIGINFNGIGYIKSDNQNCIFMSISALPEYNYSSSEELRLADLEKITTGNIYFYKIKNTSIKENNFSEDNNNNINTNGFNYKNNLFNDNMFYNKQSTLFMDNNNENNIFAKKPDLTKSPFAFLLKNNNNNNFLEKHHNTIFSSNNKNFYEKNLINNKNLFLSQNNKGINSYPTYYFPSQPFLKTNIKNNNNKYIFSNNQINFNQISNEENSNTLNNLDIDKLFSQKEKLSKALNDAIKKEKTVKDFLLDLDKEYKSSEKINIIEIDNNIFNYEDNTNKDNGISLSQKNFNFNNNKYHKNDSSYLTPFTPTIEIPCYKMELDLNEDNDIFNYNNNNNSCSKIKKIYNDYEKIKNDFNKKNFLGNKTYQKALENIENNKKYKIDNNFSKTFSNGFPKFKLQNNINNEQNENGILPGRNEKLYAQNLMKIEKLSLNDINNNNAKINYKFKNDNKLIIKNEAQNKENKLYHSLNKNLLNKSLSYSISNDKLSDSVSTISRQFVDLIIEYNLPEGKNKYNELYYNDVDQLMTVKSLKEEVTQKISRILYNTNYQNYSIEKITLLIPTEFLKDEENLINYHLRSNNYTIQAIIKYKKKLIQNKYAPKLDKPGYGCIPSISDLQLKTSEELKRINNFIIYNKYGQVEFKEPINLLGVNLNNEIVIEKNMIETGDKLDYWTVFKIYEFIDDGNNICKLKEKINQNEGKFISYKDKELIWEYIPKPRY